MTASSRQDALDWLRGIDLFPKFFFDDPKTGKYFAVAGAIEELRIDNTSGLAEVEKSIRDFAKDRVVFGGVRFDTNREPDSDWADFGSAYFFEPEKFVVGVEPFEREIAGAVKGATANPTAPPESWTAFFSSAQKALQSNTFDKLVLATKTSTTGLDFWSGLNRQFQSFTFLFQPTQEAAFCGTSPETLFRRNGSHVSCDALAGTRPVTDDQATTNHLKRDLQESQKDADEHQMVVDFLTDSLANMGNVTSGERSVRTLHRLQHLWTPITANVSDPSQLLSSIHPTPALCGAPRGRSLAWLAEHEPFDRGWYGGVVGYVSDDEECFAVAIRSMLTVGKTNHVFAGAGVISASDETEEWNEISNKRRSIESRFRKMDA